MSWARLRAWHAGLGLAARARLHLLVAAPLVWALAGAITLRSAHTEIDELFDSQLVRIARQVQALLPGTDLEANPAAALALPAHPGGAAELEDLTVAVWDRQGRLLLADQEGVSLPWLPEASGFRDLPLEGGLWRVYFLQSPRGEWLVAAGQSQHEREELLTGLLAAQLLPWLLMLPLLLLALMAALRSALRPLDTLSALLAAREPQGLAPLPTDGLPPDLRPLVEAMNGLFLRIETARSRERRFTADAAHELRTPIAALRSQWEALRLQAEAGRPTDEGAAKIAQGLERLGRLVEQMLALARIEHLEALGAPAPVDWTAVLAPVVDSLWARAESEGVDIACEGLDGALPLAGDAALLGVMLRNLLDNALRHSPRGGTVWLRGSAEGLSVLDEGPGVAADELARLGERFHRPAGALGTGSGLGLSIVQRIAALHGLTVAWGPRAEGPGFEVRLHRA